jgi:hypothetical protein
MIHNATDEFDFTKVALSPPVATTSGSYFTRITHQAAAADDAALYMYTPRCVARAGVTTDGAKRYVDLTFPASSTAMLDWSTALEEHLQQQIFARREQWFTDTEIGLDDIQSVFIPVMKPCKGGHYVLRAHISQGRSKFPTLPPVFDTNETPLNIEDVQPDVSLIAILDMQGIKFTPRSFNVVIAVKQIMILQDTSRFKQCLIRPEPAAVAPAAPPAAPTPQEEEDPPESPPTSEDEDEGSDVEIEVEEILPVPPKFDTDKKRDALKRAEWYEARATEASRRAKELKDALNSDA